MKISIIVPCYNEELNIVPLYNLIDCDLAGFNYEIIFINDGSVDHTEDELKKIYKLHSDRIVVINFSRNFGKESAIYAGLNYSRGDYVSIIDSDLQQSPKYIAEMVKFLESNNEYDMVTMYQDKRIENKRMVFFKKTFYKIINRICDIDFYQGASDFRTFRKIVRDALLQMPENFRFSKGLFSWIGFNVYYMPYVAEKRLTGNTKWTYKSLLKYGLDGIVSFSTFPLRGSLYLGMILSLIAIIYMIIVIIQHFAVDIAFSGYATIVCLILLLGGVQLMMLGIIGEYLAKTYIEGKKRPIYIVKTVYRDQE